jgi:hypothetical protein
MGLAGQINILILHVCRGQADAEVVGRAMGSKETFWIERRQGGGCDREVAH